MMGRPNPRRQRDSHDWLYAMLFRIAAGAVIAVILLPASIAPAQIERAVVVEAAAAPVAAPENNKKPDGAKAAGAKAADAKSDKDNPDGEESADGKDEKDEKKEDESDSLKRPTAPPRVPDPREFDVRPDKNALISFNFHGQPWPDVLQWLAIISGYSLDWQELPNDYINVASTKKYSLAETLDLFNRLLFDRGYTMVLQGEVMSVVKIDKLDPSLLRRVDDESQLLDLPAHNFVKITFQLPDELKADKAAEDVKPLLSTQAKVQPLLATNRLLVIDIVANLREVSRLINMEHAAATGNIVPREFPIRFARADRVADQVMILLGLDPSSRRTPQELQVEQQRLQLFQQMQQKGKDVTKFLRKGDSPQVFLAVNHRGNSILVNAPPAEMAIIKRAVEMLDVPSGSLAGAMPGSLTINKYPLVTLTPQSIVTALEDIGELDPRTQLKIDSDAKVIFAHATQRDHEKIQSMIDSLDGTGRQFEVIWLRRLPADAVAATIHDLMVGKEEEKDDNRRSYYYSYYSRRRDEQDDQPNKGFRVDADIENNRLLLWATETELKEVRRFLVKLGEIPGESGNPNTVRILDARGDEATLRLLQQIRQAWPSVAPNELRIQGAPAQEEEEDAPDEKQKLPDDVSAAKVGSSRPALEVARIVGLVTQHDQPATSTLAQVPRQADAQFPGFRHSDTHAANQPPEDRVAGTDDVRNELPPVTITINQDGRIILNSADTKALDQLEDLLNQLAPPPKTYKVFYLRYALASLVTLNLEEYFEEELEDGDSDDNWYRGWYGYPPSSTKSNKVSPGLARRRKIRFIYDYDTNSILVSNASPEQLAVIEDLIKIYDMPPSEDSISARRFKIFKLQYSRADKVAKTIKEVYRDLLSSKDKEFEKGQGEKEKSSQLTSFYRVYGSSNDDRDEKPKKIKASFAGALSVGVDEISNILIVSAQEEWMPSIAEMIEILDVEAQPYTPSVQVLNTDVSAATLQAALTKAFAGNGSNVQVAKPPPTDAKPPEGQQPNQPAASSPTEE